jgi:hypothetical protein
MAGIIADKAASGNAVARSALETNSLSVADVLTAAQSVRRTVDEQQSKGSGSAIDLSALAIKLAEKSNERLSALVAEGQSTEGVAAKISEKTYESVFGENAETTPPGVLAHRTNLNLGTSTAATKDVAYEAIKTLGTDSTKIVEEAFRVEATTYREASSVTAAVAAESRVASQFSGKFDSCEADISTCAAVAYTPPQPSSGGSPGGGTTGASTLPVITINMQPSNQTAANGIASFSVSASVTNSASPSYQWQKQESGSGSFSVVSGATGSTLTLSSLTNAADNGDVYRVVVSATGGATSVTSSNATLTVNPCAANGWCAGEMTYYLSGQATTLDINGSGTWNSQTYTGGVLKPIITISSQPSNQTAVNGSASFSVSASFTNSATPSYQWQKQESGSGSFSNVSGETGSTLTLSGLTNATDNGDVYRVVVSASGGAESVTSSIATLTVAAPTNTPGGAAGFLVSGVSGHHGHANGANGTYCPDAYTDAAGRKGYGKTTDGNYAIIWEQGGQGAWTLYSFHGDGGDNISSVTSNSITPPLTGWYNGITLSPSNGCGEVTTTFSPTTITISSQPSNQTAVNGSASFIVSASFTNGATLSYQWQKQESGAGSFSDVSGETGSTLALLNLTNAADNGDVYRVVVSASGGAESVTSSIATLTVAAPTTTTTGGAFALSGAGNAAVNGCYVEAGIINAMDGNGMRPYYTNGTYFVWYQNSWNIRRSLDDGNAPEYWNSSNQPTAPNSWDVMVPFGQEPAPTHTTGCGGTTTTTAAPAGFTPMAVLLTSGTSYTVPAGATSMKAWAVGGGGGGMGGAGGTAFKTWSVAGGDAVAYVAGAAGVYIAPGYSYNSTNGGDSTVTYGGVTITGRGGGKPTVISVNGVNTLSIPGGTYSGGDGGADGGAGNTYYPSNNGPRYVGGAVGGNNQPLLICAGYDGAGRRPATNVSGLLEAVALAGGAAIQSCGATAAFGSGGHAGDLDGDGFQYSASQNSGLGGGGHIDGMAGGGAVVLYFTGGGEASTTTTAAPSGTTTITISEQPKNSYAISSNDTATFSVAATINNGDTIKYQWQYYGQDPNTSESGWYEVPGQTSNNLTMSPITFGSMGLNVEMYTTPLFRCVLTGVNSPVSQTTTVARWVRFDSMGAWAKFLGSNGLDPDGHVTVNGKAYSTLTLSSGEDFSVEVSDPPNYPADSSWYSSDAFTVKIQVSDDATTWSDISSANFRSNGFSNMTQVTALSGVTKYYRFLLKYNWPFTTTNGTQSSRAAPDSVHVTGARVTWPSAYSATSVEYLVVAGGGGGSEGGGGGGGVLTGTQSFASGANLTVTIGAGGNKGSAVWNGGSRGSNGVNSVFGSLAAIGGGGGGVGYQALTDGLSGGSGGGGGNGRYLGAYYQSGNAYTALMGFGGSATSGQGNAGGRGCSDFQYDVGGGGGGGGAGQAGSNGSRSSSGRGGDGITSSITGSSLYYGGGGEGQPDGNNATGGGLGGGGSYSVDGTANTGGGGGGADVGSSTSAGNGGSGVVIIAYQGAALSSIGPGLTYSLDTTSRAGWRIYRFTAGTGSITF